MDERKDYSASCNGDDDDTNNPCWKCINFFFPIGCMIDELKEIQGGTKNE